MTRQVATGCLALAGLVEAASAIASAVAVPLQSRTCSTRHADCHSCWLLLLWIVRVNAHTNRNSSCTEFSDGCNIQRPDGCTVQLHKLGNVKVDHLVSSTTRTVKLREEELVVSDD